MYRIISEKENSYLGEIWQIEIVSMIFISLIFAMTIKFMTSIIELTVLENYLHVMKNLINY